MGLSSLGFLSKCLIYSVGALSCGTLMMFYSHEVFAFSYGNEIASKLLGSTSRDQLLIKTSDCFSGLLLFAVGMLLFMVAFVKDRDFQIFFAKGCVLLHIALAIWRFILRGSLKNLDVIGLDWLLGILFWHFHGCCFLCTVGEKNTIRQFKTRSWIGLIQERQVLELILQNADGSICVW